MKTLITTLFTALLLITTMQGQSKEEVYKQADKMPTYTGGLEQLKQDLETLLHYPPEADTRGLEGKVTVSFVVSPKGEVTDVNVVKTDHEIFNQEAIMAVSSLKNWEPGKIKGKKVNVEMTIPVNFVLDKKSESLTEIVVDSNKKNPLYVVDGTPLDSNQEIDYYNIQSIRVMKGEKAIEKFGLRAQDGVILISTKQATPR